MTLEKFRQETMTCARRGNPVTQSKAACSVNYLKAQNPELTASNPLVECRHCEIGKAHGDEYVQLGGEKPIFAKQGHFGDGKARPQPRAEKKIKPASEYRCAYCGKEFKYPSYARAHEKRCSQRPGAPGRGHRRKSAPVKAKKRVRKNVARPPTGALRTREGAYAPPVITSSDLGSTPLAFIFQVDVSLNPKAELKDLFDLRDKIDAAIRARLEI